MKTPSVLRVALIFSLLASGDVFADPSTDSKSRKLEETIQALERRVAALEDQLRAQKASIRAPSGRANWRKLRNGMSESEVEELLGSPAKVISSGSMTIWYYRPGGNVSFDEHVVDGWSEP